MVARARSTHVSDDAARMMTTRRHDDTRVRNVRTDGRTYLFSHMACELVARSRAPSRLFRECVNIAYENLCKANEHSEGAGVGSVLSMHVKCQFLRAPPKHTHTRSLALFETVRSGRIAMRAAQMCGHLCIQGWQVQVSQILGVSSWRSTPTVEMPPAATLGINWSSPANMASWLSTRKTVCL